MSTQQQNDEMLELLRPTFQARAEPNFAIANAVSTFLMLPELRGFWPFSSVNESGNLLDLSGQGRTLTNTGAVARAVAGLLPYGSFTGANYFSRADEAGLDITGALTMGGWFYATAIAGTQVFLGKMGAVGTRSYQMYVDAAGNVSLAVSVDGTAQVVVPTTTAPFTAGAWHFVAGRYTPGAELAVFVGLAKTINVVGIPAALFNGASSFRVGANDLGFILTGRGTLCFLCAAALSDAVIKNLYHQTKVLFGY